MCMSLMGEVRVDVRCVVDGDLGGDRVVLSCVSLDLSTSFLACCSCTSAYSLSAVIECSQPRPTG